jgi:hypothetical protein
MTIKSNFPSIRPSLNLDFANTRALDPRITFARTTTAAYYDGKTTAKAEENLLVQSQDFTTTWSASSSSATANTEVAPDGTTTADTLMAASGSGLSPRIAQTASFVSGLEYVFSCFVKAGTQDYIQLLFPSGAFGSLAYANFDVTSGAGAVGTVGATATASIVDVGNGWFRCVAKSTAVSSASSTPTLVIITSPTAARLESWNPAGTETVYLWGAQLEQRSSVTAYTPTTTAPITNYIPVLQTAASGVARFDHNPITGESLGLLVEEQRTNLLTYSDDFSDAAWTKTRSSITANTIVAPDGTLTGDKLVENTDNNTHPVSQTQTLSANTTYTLSVTLKAGERTRAVLQTANVANWAASVTTTFDLSAGTVASGTGAITSLGNGWYRCSITATFGASSLAGGLNIIPVISGTTTSYTGDGFSGIYIWGAQLEVGAFATSYIPTVAATVTRNADAASMTGANFTSWYRADEGTLYVDSTFPQGVFAPTAELYQSATYNIVIRANGTNTQGLVLENNNAQFVSNIANTSPFKAALAYKTNDAAFSLNASSPSTDTSVILPGGITSLEIGRRGAQDRYMGNTIKKIAFYPSRLSNAQLQALTTV